MGSCCSGSKKQNEDEIDEAILGDFLSDKKNLENIWKQFNKNEDDVLDAQEFDKLLYTALKIFCKERDSSMPPPSQEAMEPFVNKLRNELKPRVDTNGDGQISFEEFKTFGDYLKQEYGRLQQAQKNNNN